MASMGKVNEATAKGQTLGQFQVHDGSNSLVGRMREIITVPVALEGWNKCWEEEVTPWDLGQTTPAVEKLVQSGTLPINGRVLVPGCGGGYDVVALSSPDRFVTGLDISEIAVQKAKERFSSSTKTGFFEFVVADIFTWVPKEPFDVIFEYVFFCAIHPSLRSAWARRMDVLLKPNGELITLMYLLQGQKGGPPFNVTVSDYEDVLVPLGFVLVSIEENDVAVEPRKGIEKIARWKKVATK